MNEQFINQLFIYTRKAADDPDHIDYFECTYRHILRDIDGLKVDFTCMNFHFKDWGDQGDTKSLLFAKREKIYELNYETAKVRDLKTIYPPL